MGMERKETSFKNLHEDSAQAEHQYRSEGGIIGHSYDGLHSRPGHLLHGDARDLLALECAGDFPVGSLNPSIPALTSHPSN